MSATQTTADGTRPPRHRSAAMPLPDLSPIFSALLADAATPPIAPGSPIAPPEWAALRDTLINLGGWGAILWSLAWSAIRRVDQFATDTQKALQDVRREIRGTRRELARIRHAPPPAAYMSTPQENPPK